MKIFFIHSRYSPFGGGENYVSSLRHLLENNGHSVYLFSFDDNISLQDSKNFVFRDPFSIHERNPLILSIRYLLRFYFHPLVYFRLRRLISEKNPDIIHIHANDRYGISVLLAVADLGIPILQTIHANDSICLSPTFKRSYQEFCRDTLSLSCLAKGCISCKTFFSMAPSYIIRNFLAKRIIDRFIAPNNFLKKRLESSGFYPVEFMPLFVEEHNPRSENNMPGLIFAPGTLIEMKGFQYLIQAMEQIVKCNRDAKLHIAGKGPYSLPLLQLTKTAGLEEQVIFHGFLNRTSLNELYSAADIVVFPSLFLEVCPLVIMEAMSFGKPIIAGKYSGIEDMLDGDSGYLIDPKNPSEIGDAACDILKNPDRAAVLGLNAYGRFRETYDASGHYHRITSLYSILIEAKSQS